MRDLLRWMVWERLTRPRPRDPSPEVFPRALPAHPARVVSPQVAVTWVGHASFLVQRLNLLTDPMWSDRASPSLCSAHGAGCPGVPFEALPPIDAVLISHNHYDHLDDRTCVAWRVAIPTPPGSSVRRGPVPGARGRRVHEMDWWDEASLGAMRIACAPARHFSARGIRDRGATLWCSWSILGPSRRVYFGGDSAYHPEFTRIGERHGPFDVALLPIGAYDPRWFMQDVHMNAEEGVQAYLDLCAPHGRESHGHGPHALGGPSS
jgi:L-ascorbate metabolism protein UlaG (beta-lactamase superfamily)